MVTQDEITEAVVQAFKQQGIQEVVTTLVNHGRAFVVSDRFNDISNGDSIFLYIENPDKSGFDYNVLLVPRASGLTDLDISFDATEETKGADADVRNLRSSTPRSFTGVARKTQTGDTGSYTHGTTFIEDIVPGGERGTRIGGQLGGGIGFTIDGGDNKLLELRNEAGGNLSRLALNAVIFEIDGTFLDSPKFT